MTDDLSNRVAILEFTVNGAGGFAGTLRAEMRTLGEELCGEMRSLGEELRTQMRRLNEETCRAMRVLHEDVVARIGLLQEGPTLGRTPRRRSKGG